MQHSDDPARWMNAPELPAVTRPVIDAHVHLFPPRVFDAIWRWFDAHAWPVRYRLYADQILEYLERQNVSYLFALHYSHKEGMARALNAFIAELARRSPRILPFGTVLPGEPDAAAVVDEALGTLNLVGLKLHCHVQKVGPDDPRMYPIYEALAHRGKVLVLHAGREPHSDAYGFDCRKECGLEPVRRVVERFPELKLIVPHLGMNEPLEFMQLARESRNLYLDTAMAVSGFLIEPPDRSEVLATADKLLFGTDFPQLPYPWGRELHWLQGLELPPEALDAVLWGNAARLVGLGVDPPAGT